MIEVDVFNQAVNRVWAERVRQEQKGNDRRALGEWEWKTCADPTLDPCAKLAVLMEEVGEVAFALNEERVGKEANLREELTHVAAVAVAWLESL